MCYSLLAGLWDGALLTFLNLCSVYMSRLLLCWMLGIGSTSCSFNPPCPILICQHLLMQIKLEVEEPASVGASGSNGPAFPSNNASGFRAKGKDSVGSGTVSWLGPMWPPSGSMGTGGLTGMSPKMMMGMSPYNYGKSVDMVDMCTQLMQGGERCRGQGGHLTA